MTRRARRSRHRRRATPPVALLALALLVGACGDDGAPTDPGDGSLAITVSGLPAGVPPSITVTGPGDFTRPLASPATLAALPSGTYTIVAADVTSGGARFDATPETQEVVVARGARATARHVAYAVATARLDVSVLGLPAGAAGGVTVTGPAGFTRTVTASVSLDLLEPGTYTITAADVPAAMRTWRPDPATQAVTLAASRTARAATVAYGAGSATLDVGIAGLPAGTDASVRVTGPGGYDRTVAATTTVRHLDAGTYTVVPALVGSSLTTHAPTPASQAVVLADGGAGAAAVAYGSAPLQLGVELVAEGFAAPVFVTAPDSDQRLFVVERAGRVRTVEHGVVSAIPFLDISSRVNFAGERGMLGMAFDPQYATNGWLYVYYVSLAGSMVVERIGSTPGADVANGDAAVVISIPHGGSEHHGGLVAFGPDGMLYVAPGDGGCCGDPHNNAQDRTTLLGKVLRLDVRAFPYAIPPDNPFSGRAGMRGEIWAYGLRNPWRFSFDAAEELLYVGDVGQDAREEVNVAPVTTAGLNYGWRIMEGTACFIPSAGCATTGLTPPAIEYSHDDGCSVTGGYVYRGQAIPELTGHYLYSDFCRGWLRSFRWANGAAGERRTWAGIDLPQTVSFGRDGAGELYVISGSRLRRIVRR